MEIVLPETVSTHIWRYGFFEADVCRFMLGTLGPGMNFVDVGAHYGFFTLLASHIVGPAGRVLAIEPMPVTVRQLYRNAALVPTAQNVEVVPCAAYHANTELVFRDYGLLNAGLNSLYKPRTHEAARSVSEVTVAARMCDEIIAEANLSHVELIKIDAESSELDVLGGLEKTLMKWRPRLIVEVGDFDLEGVPSSATLLHWFTARGYTPFECSNNTLVPHLPRVRYGYGNLLFVPF